MYHILVRPPPLYRLHWGTATLAGGEAGGLLRQVSSLLLEPAALSSGAGSGAGAMTRAVGRARGATVGAAGRACGALA